MGHYDVDGIFTRMREACSAQNESQLAKFLGVQSSTIVAWKNAKFPPYRACYELYEKTGVTVEWLINGKDPQKFPEKPKVNVFNLPLDDFIDGYFEALKNTSHLGAISIDQNADYALIEHAATIFYNSMNNDINLARQSDKKPMPGQYLHAAESDLDYNTKE
ncbi:helix-turn-helix domain-containing protein [Alteromonas sp. a30]|uniref:helix-turn-helix domain-containing protein n=1 Tax=Alteromonas sp. a30 TaxID=2730917 RepID=UPI00227F72DE|nr:helix-turn-helix domain-containing protein [Alteromonas sp. a30]MCY7296772.1 hypothetical protein [Alteromonas sp. a30]